VTTKKLHNTVGKGDLRRFNGTKIDIPERKIDEEGNILEWFPISKQWRIVGKKVEIKS
jgi:hypothetical protein